MQASSGSADVADRTWPKSHLSRLELTVVPSAVRIARCWTAGQLAAAGPGGEAADEDLIDTAVLVVSELVTNAIQAVSVPAEAPPSTGPVKLAGRILSFADLPLPRGPGGRRPASAETAAARAASAALVSGLPLAVSPRVCLVIARFAALVRIEVHDSSQAAVPPPRPSDDDDESGRGLTVVAALAQSWGWQPGRAGKMVWCELFG